MIKAPMKLPHGLMVANPSYGELGAPQRTKPASDHAEETRVAVHGDSADCVIDLERALNPIMQLVGDARHDGADEHRPGSGGRDRYRPKLR